MKVHGADVGDNNILNISVLASLTDSKNTPYLLLYGWIGVRWKTHFGYPCYSAHCWTPCIVVGYIMIMVDNMENNVVGGSF